MKARTGVWYGVASMAILCLEVLVTLYGQCSAVIGTNIDPVEGCEVLTVQFYDYSTGGSDRTWDFGDGSEPSNAQNPTHSFIAGSGDTTYTVRLTIDCTSGGTQSATKEVRVFAKPVIDFDQDKYSVCAITDSVCFTNRVPFDPGNTYLWNYGDGTLSNEYEACKSYSTPGIYDLELTATNSKGCVNSVVEEDYIEVIRVPNTAFTVSTYMGCSPVNLFFKNTTDTADAEYSNWLWNYGDGSPIYHGFSSGPHLYLDPGVYQIRLGATNALGCYNFSTQAVTIEAAPETSFSAESPICLNSHAQIQYEGAEYEDDLFEWDFDGPESVSSPDSGKYSVSWSTAGIKNISLTATEGDCTASDSLEVVVNPLARVYLHLSIDQDTICQGQEVTISASPKNFPRYSFFINEAEIQRSGSHEFRYSHFDDGDQVYVKVVDNNGCSELVSDTLSLVVLPTPSLTLSSSAAGDTVCSGDPVTFTASPAGFDTYTFFWGNQEIQSSPSASCVIPGYDKKEPVYAKALHQGCSGKMSNLIDLTVNEPLPAPQVNCGQTENTEIEFVWEEVTDAASYEIRIDGGAWETASSGSTGLSHQISGLTESDSATLEVRALDGSACGFGWVSDPKTCIAQNCNSITFDAGPDLKVCEGDEAYLEIHHISPSNFSISWNGGAPVKDSGYSLLPAGSTVVPVSLIDSTQLHCSPVTKKIAVEVIETPEVSLQSSVAGEICQETAIELTVQPSSYDRYFFFDNSQIVQDSSWHAAVIEHPQQGHHYFAIASKEGCTEATDTLQANVQNPLDQPVVNAVSSDEQSVTFEWDPVPGATGYRVSIDGGAFIHPSSGPEGRTHIQTGLAPGASVTANVMATGEAPCGNSDLSLPAVGFATTCTPIVCQVENQHRVCKGDSVTIRIDDLSIDRYTISWNGGEPGTGHYRTFFPDSDTLIQITIRNSDQPSCPPRREQVEVEVIPVPGALSLALTDGSDTLCEGERIEFTALPVGYGSYAFYDGYSLLQEGFSNLYSTRDDLHDGSTVRALARNGVCAGPPSDSIRVHMANRLKVPQVNCYASTDTSITIHWDQVPDAEAYQVRIDGGSFLTPSSGETGLFHQLDGLSGGESRTFEVMAAGSGPCGNSAVSEPAVCTAVPCDTLTFMHTPYDTLCSGDSLQLTVSNISTGNYSLSWNGGPGVTDTSMMFRGRSDSLISVELSDLSQPACPSVKKLFDIDVITLPQVNLFAANDTICEGEPAEFLAYPTSLEQYRFFNSSSQLLQESPRPFMAYDTATADQEVYVEVSSQGCTAASSPVRIAVGAMPELRLQTTAPDTICEGELVGFEATPGYDQYLFKNEIRTVATTDSNSASLEVTGDYITVEAASRIGCRTASKDTVYFNLRPLPEATLICPTDTVCPGEPVNLLVSPGTYQQYDFFMNEDLLASSDNHRVTTRFFHSTDTLRAVVTDQHGCTSLAQNGISPYVYPFPENRINSSAEGLCLNDSAQLTAEFDAAIPAGHFYWSTGQTDTSIIVRPSVNTTYYLFSEFGHCVLATDTVVMEVDAETPPEAFAGEDDTICLSESYQLQATGGLFYYWSPDTLFTDPTAADPMVTLDTTTSLVVRVTNDYCSDTDTVQIYIDKCLEDLTEPVPQIITPNGDEFNEYWILPDIWYFQQNRVEIYNRWGTQVYSSSPYNNQWNGCTNRGEPLPDGVYYYVIDLGNGSKARSGYVIIHR